MIKDKVYFITNGSPLSMKVKMYLDINKIKYELLEYGKLTNYIRLHIKSGPPVVIYNHNTIYGFDAKKMNKLFNHMIQKNTIH